MQFLLPQDVNDIMTEQLSARLMADLAEMDADNSVTVNELRARAMLLRGRVLSATQRATPLDIAEHYFKPVSKKYSRNSAKTSIISEQSAACQSCWLYVLMEFLCTTNR